MKDPNEKYCTECGSLISAKAEICPKCGVRQMPAPGIVVTDSRWLTVLLPCFFLGVFGIHRFYTGHSTIGLIQLITLGGCGIWTLVDLIVIITGGFRDAQGNLIKNN